MLHNRLEGIRVLRGLGTGLVLVVWFVALLLWWVLVEERMNFEQVHLAGYLLAIGAAVTFTFRYPREVPAEAPPRDHWLAAVGLSNRHLFSLALFLFALIFATKDKAVSRVFVAVYLATTWVWLVFINRYLHDLLGRVLFRGRHRLRTALVGTCESESARHRWQALQAGWGVEMVGLVTPPGNGPPEACPLPWLGEIDRLEDLVLRHGIGQLVLLEPRRAGDWVEPVIAACRQLGCRLLIHNPWQDFLDQPLQVVREGHQTFFTMGEEPLQDPTNRMLKRSLDLLVALPVTLLLLPPLAFLVKLVQIAQAPGPLLYRQVRSGQVREPFVILKFRTMRVGAADAEEEARQARAEDQRVYPFGRWLRRTSLDEMPQFLNVLAGHMSVVGPRPHLIAHDDLFSRYVTLYRSRHFAKPGITGLAQHLGFRGEIRDPEAIAQRVRLDLEYIARWSLWLDLGIILKTAWQVFFPRSTAY